MKKILLLIPFYFTGCLQAPSLLNQQARSTVSSLNTLTLSSSQNPLSFGDSTTISSTGTAPFSFSLASSNGTINSSTGVLQRKWNIPSLTVYAGDSSGDVGSLDLTLSTKTMNIGTTSGEGTPFVVTDSNQNMYFLMSTQGDLYAANQSAPASNDLALVKYDAYGNVLWSKQWGSTGSEMPSAIALSSDENYVFVSASTDGNIAGAFAGGNSDAYYAKIDASNGTTSCEKQFGTSEDDSVSALLADSTNLYILGRSAGDIDADADSPFCFFGTCYKYYYLQKTDLNCSNATWTATRTSADGMTEDSPTALAQDGSGNILIYGGSVFGGMNLFAMMRSFDSSGNLNWSNDNVGSCNITSTNLNKMLVDGNSVYIGLSLATNICDAANSVQNTDMKIYELSTLDGTTINSNVVGVNTANEFIRATGIVKDSSNEAFLIGVTTGDILDQTMTGTRDIILSKLDLTTLTLTSAKFIGEAGKDLFNFGFNYDGVQHYDEFLLGIQDSVSFDGVASNGSADAFFVMYNSSFEKK